MYLKLASMAKHQSTNNSAVTIFTDGPPSDDPAIQKGLDASKALEFIVEERKIKRLEAAGDVGVNVVLEDGEKVYMGFLVHKPITTLVAEDLVDGLGIETEQSPMAKTIKRHEPWGTTNVKGVYVAGDVGTPMTNVVGAMATGNILSRSSGSGIVLTASTLGSFAAAAIAHELCDEDDEIALEKYKEISNSR